MSDYQRGVQPSGVPCSHCHNQVMNTEARWYEGLPYHTHCFKMYLSNVIKGFDKKAQLGTLTIAESKLLEDCLFLLDVERKDTRLPPKSFVPKNHEISTDIFGVIPKRRELAFKSNQYQHFKELEAKRSERWAWEGFELFEKQVLGLDCKEEPKAIPDTHKDVIKCIGELCK